MVFADLNEELKIDKMAESNGNLVTGRCYIVYVCYFKYLFSLTLQYTSH